jgi:hypothetical protein
VFIAFWLLLLLFGCLVGSFCPLLFGYSAEKKARPNVYYIPCAVSLHIL